MNMCKPVTGRVVKWAFRGHQYIQQEGVDNALSAQLHCMSDI